jgi:hypothetical protein
MEDTEKIVAAIYAAKATWSEPTNLSSFLGHYEACIAALGERRAAAKEAALDRSIQTMKSGY